MPLLPRLLSQHTEEAAYLWLLRDRAVHAPEYLLSELAYLDGRIDAHLDGLMLAGEDGWSALRDELEWKEPGEIFAASAIAFWSGEVGRIRPVLELARTSHELTRALIAALGFLPIESVAPRVKQLTASSESDLREIGLAASAIHRLDRGNILLDALESESANLRARAFRAAGELGRRDLLPSLSAGVMDNEAIAGFWATWSLGLLGDHGVVEILREIAVTEFSRSIDALHLASRLADVASSNSWRMRLASDAATKRHAVIAAGAIGDPSAIPWLIEQMCDASLARVAGESFTTITGSDLALLNLDLSPPQNAESGANDEADDEKVAVDPDEKLPWPNVELIREWWSSNSQRFVSGNRYLLGGVIGPDTLPLVLRDGKQRHRAAAAIELMLTSPKGTTPLFEVRANARVQKQSLGASTR